MAEKQQALAQAILKDPAVESLSSFIGVDGINTTLNSGRILINLKPLEERKISALEVIRRLQLSLERIEESIYTALSRFDGRRSSRRTHQDTLEDATRRN